MDVRSRAAIKIALILVTGFLGVPATTLFSEQHLEIKAHAAELGQRSGAAVYSQMCSRCHGIDGRAKTAKGRAVDAVDFTSNEWSPDPARDARTVTRGKEDMPSFKTKLKPAEIEAVVNYIRRFKN